MTAVIDGFRHFKFKRVQSDRLTLVQLQNSENQDPWCIIPKMKTKLQKKMTFSASSIRPQNGEWLFRATMHGMEDTDNN